MNETAYKQSGVDIEAAAELVENIKPHIQKTNRTGVMSGIGGFGALFDLKATGYKDPVLVSGTDGVGTKIKIAIETGHHDTIGIDAVAMCVNDVVVQGAEPLFFLDYFATGKLDTGVAEAVIKGVAKGCEIAGCALIGGETAEMPGLYATGDYDLAGFTVGAVERENIITGDTITAGDSILALASSGLHSNGFSLVRHLIKTTQSEDYTSPAPFAREQTLAEALLIPTRIYVKSILSALSHHPRSIKGLAHITGGGLLENVPRILPATVCAEIDTGAWTLPPVFRWLMQIGKLTPRDMGATLNAGIGMVVICAPAHKDALTEHFQNNGETVYDIGTIRPRTDGGPRVILKQADTHWAGA